MRRSSPWRKPGSVLLLVCSWIGSPVADTALLAHAQQKTWRPEKPVEIVVPAAPGGAVDATARLLQKLMQQNRWVETPVLVVNRAGGGGNVALSYLDQRAGDGHYLLNSTMGLMTNHILGLSKTTYTDYTPVAILYGEYMTVVVRPGSALKTALDVQDRLKADPQSLNIAIGVSVGGTNYLTIALLTKAMGIDVKKLKTVVFQSNSQAVTALMGGHVDIATLSTAAALHATEQGQLRIIGITADRRGEGTLARVPTFREQGYDLVFSNTRFLIGPRGMTPAQTAYWDTILERVVQNEEWKADLAKDQSIADYVASRRAGERLAVLNRQLRGALADAGLAKD